MNKKVNQPKWAAFYFFIKSVSQRIKINKYN